MKNQSFTSTLATALLLITIKNTSAQPERQGPYETCAQVPSLKCRNGSTCIVGKATFDSKYDHLELQTHESGYHCDCLPGTIGHECQLKAEDCGGGSDDPFGSILHSCYHGSECLTSGSGKYCDCNSLNKEGGATASKFAGLMCEHEATSLCAVSLVAESAPNGQFCTNHGQCVKMVTEGEAHPGCECRAGWMGDHCEIRADAFAAMGLNSMGDDVNGGGNKTAGKVLFSILAISIVLVVILIVFLVVKSKRETVGPRAKAVGKTASDIGIGDLEANGSGTLGSEVDQVEGNVDEVENDGDDLSLKEEVASGEFQIDSKDDEEENDEPSEKEIL